MLISGVQYFAPARGVHPDGAGRADGAGRHAGPIIITITSIIIMLMFIIIIISSSSSSRSSMMMMFIVIVVVRMAQGGAQARARTMFNLPTSPGLHNKIPA